MKNKIKMLNPEKKELHSKSNINNVGKYFLFSKFLKKICFQKTKCLNKNRRDKIKVFLMNRKNKQNIN